MRRAAILIVLASLMLAGCNLDPGEIRYVNRANPAEVLTINPAKSVKTKLIYTFHGISTGSYTMKTGKGTISGSFSSDSEGVKFRPADGQAETVKFKSDGSFDYGNGTWTPAPILVEKSLKAVASSEDGKS